MTPISAAVYRLVAELACIVGVVCAAVLAYADKSPWVWCWFLLFAFMNIITEAKSVSKTITTTERNPRESQPQ